MVKGTRIFNGRSYRLFGKTPSFDSQGKPLSRIHQKNMAENAAEQIRKRNYNARVINWAGGSGIFVAPKKYNTRMARRPVNTISGRASQTIFIPDEAKVHYIHPKSEKQIEHAMEKGIPASTMISESDARNLKVDKDTKGTYASTAVDPNQVSEELGVIGIVNPIHVAEPIMTQDGNVFITKDVPASQIVRFTANDLKDEGDRRYVVKDPKGIQVFESSSLAEAQTYVNTMVDSVQRRGYYYGSERERIPSHQFKLEVQEVIN